MEQVAEAPAREPCGQDLVEPQRLRAKGREAQGGRQHGQRDHSSWHRRDCRALAASRAVTVTLTPR
jgi:hypothetical protein